MRFRATRCVFTLIVLLVLHAAAGAAATLPAPVSPAAFVQPPSAPEADEIMAHARSTAAAEHKNILVIFSASWCGPCHLLERFLDDPATGPIMSQAFLPVRLDVGEHPGDTRHADTPGAVKLEASLGGASAGFPFFVVLSPSGHVIVNSFRLDSQGKEAGNIGYPALPVEIDWFMHMLHEAAPSMQPQQTATIRDWLQQHSKS